MFTPPGTIQIVGDEVVSEYFNQKYGQGFVHSVIILEYVRQKSFCVSMDVGSNKMEVEVCVDSFYYDPASSIKAIKALEEKMDKLNII